MENAKKISNNCITIITEYGIYHIYMATTSKKAILNIRNINRKKAMTKSAKKHTHTYINAYTPTIESIACCKTCHRSVSMLFS